MNQRNSFRRLLEQLKRFIKRTPEPPEDPHSYVPAPRKPKPGSRSAAAVIEEPEP